MYITIGIACVPERLNRAIALKNSFPSHYKDRVFLGIDYLHEGSWIGHKKAWLTYTANTTHHLTIEDDVILCPDFISYLEGAIAANSNALVSLYAGPFVSAGVNYAKKNNLNWFKGGVPSGQAVLMPIDMLKDFLAWEEINCPVGMKYEDTRLYGYMKDKNIYTWFTQPSLVEHGMPMNSSLGFNNRGKVAIDFMKENRVVNWDAIPVNSKVFKTREDNKERVWKRIRGNFGE